MLYCFTVLADVAVYHLKLHCFGWKPLLVKPTDSFIIITQRNIKCVAVYPIYYYYYYSRAISLTICCGVFCC